MKKSDYIRLSLLYELSTTPKPGCVDRNHEHIDTSFNDFITSAISVSRVFEENKTSKLGSIISLSAKGMARSHEGGNTHFGAVLLLSPLYKASESLNEITPDSLRKTASSLIERSDVEDAANFYRALDYVEVGGLEEKDVKELDATSDLAIKEVTEKNITFKELMEKSKQRDTIAKELINGFEKTYEGFKFLKEKDLNNENLVKTFISLLKYPDTHVAKVHGKDQSKKLSERAKQIIENDYSIKQIKKLDKRLNEKGISPGTTADLLSSVIYLKLLYDNNEFK
ncbi:MAG: Triphosphoribosyl-dephospho-CoA synthetase, CitG [Candidatus Methanohalarchaeum thermophilum]|uniref:Triphosphoribosyl-dephospho-CoA synthetase, CitG n=1 Tax=Methanohalarchaeum thermophilum TaxID=1903181 RepID=A0A1Q6DXT1_METT1|nr:MAG: Triphosphoribosyl-dephospho-CoA synthetase, CitG [Candidatus Methanohalarchaeum thermophilum]